MITNTPISAVTSPSSGKTEVLWRAGLMAGVAAAAATFAVAAIARAADVSLEARPGDPIPLLGFAQVTLMAALIGLLLAKVLSRRAARPKHTFVSTAIVLSVASLVPPLLIDTDVATKVVLIVTHIVAAAIVIPVLASRLAD